jgi:YD repeat-containing protein
VLGLSLVGLWAPGAYARPSSDREEEGLLGPVRLVVTQEAFLTQTDRYDAAGWLVERLQEGIQSAQRLWPLRFLYEYDPGGEGRAERVWDGRGELVKETRVVYDARGQRIAEVAAWSDGTFDNASFYTYDPEGRRVSGLHYNATAVINRNTCSYDHQGRLIRERFARNYQYDARGQLVVTPNLFEFGYEVLSTYDAQGHVREKIVTDLSGHPQTRSEFEYDERGNQIEERTYNERGTLTDHKQYRYEYDPAGNWTSENLNWYRLSEGTSRPYRTQARIRTIQYH